MPLINRVTPYGDLIATPTRGLVFGNRGCLHDRTGRIRRSWAVRRWIACRPVFRGRRRPMLQPGRYTELFFLDEATALAAGHRPCAECRHDDYRRFADWWATAYGGLPRTDRVATIDARLHAERLDADGARRLHPMPADALPDGTMIDLDGAAWLVAGRRIHRWTPAGYTDARPRPRGTAPTITPPALIGLLGSGWASALPLIHPTGPRI